MQTRAYSICRRCAAVFPAGRRCPKCEGDAQAAQAIAAAIAHAIDQTPPPRRAQRRGAVLAAAALLAFVLALGVTVAAIASPGGGAAPAATSGSGSGSGPGGPAHVGQ